MSGRLCPAKLRHRRRRKGISDCWIALRTAAFGCSFRRQSRTSFSRFKVCSIVFATFFTRASSASVSSGSGLVRMSTMASSSSLSPSRIARPSSSPRRAQTPTRPEQSFHVQASRIVFGDQLLKALDQRRARGVKRRQPLELAFDRRAKLLRPGAFSPSRSVSQLVEIDARKIEQSFDVVTPPNGRSDFDAQDRLIQKRLNLLGDALDPRLLSGSSRSARTFSAMT